MPPYAAHDRPPRGHVHRRLDRRIVSDRSWRTVFGAYVTDAWYAGSDYDARREQVGWDEPGSDLTDTATRRDGSAVGWIDAGIAPPPNLETKLVARDAPPVRIVEEFVPQSVTNPAPGTYVFDFGQNFAGWPQLNLTTPVPAGTVIRMSPAEGLQANGSGFVNQGSLGPRRPRHRHVQHVHGRRRRARDLASRLPVLRDAVPPGHRAARGLPRDDGPDHRVPSDRRRPDRRLRHHVERADQPDPPDGPVLVRQQHDVDLHRLPGAKKQSYPADYTMVMGAIERNYDLASYLRGHMRHFAEGQSIADTPMRGNVALKVPVHDWGYTGQFGDEINWGNGIILVPAFLYELYGDTDTMATYYDEMVFYHDYIVREHAGAGALPDHIVNAALSDWVSASRPPARSPARGATTS